LLPLVRFLSSSFFLLNAIPARVSPSFPTRRSSDLSFSRQRSRARQSNMYTLVPLTTGMSFGFSPPIILRAMAPATCPSEAKLLRSEEHTSELQSRSDLVCRLLLEKKNHNR